MSMLQPFASNRRSAGAEVPGLTFVVHLGSLREVVSYQAFQVNERVTQDQTVGQVGLDGDGADTVVADPGRCRIRLW